MVSLLIATLACAMQPTRVESADRYHYPDGAAYSSANRNPVSRAVQVALQKSGYDVGLTSGEYGAETRAAVKRFQRDKGLPETATITLPVLKALGLR